MYVQIVLWDIRASTTRIGDLRDYVREYAVDAYSTLVGMRLKIWVSDVDRGLWGAVYLWDDQAQMPALFGVSRVIELIGYPPTSVGGFALEAVTEGKSAFPILRGLGLAMEEDTEA